MNQNNILMKTRIAAICTLALLFACNKNEENKKPIDTAAPEAAAMLSGKSCYQYIKGRDTVTMFLAMNANNANGELIYKLDGKDTNEGTFSGTFIGDTLYADYSFNAEGTQSIRETVFLRQNDILIQGFGEMVENDNKQSFKDPKNIKFDQSLILAKADCN
jgi:hypothetical protein